MKKTFLIVIALIVSVSGTQAQLLKTLGGLVKSRAVQKATSETDKQIDKVLNGSKKDEGAPAEKNQQKTAATDIPRSYSKYDFVAGEKIIYIDDFAGAATGELPLGWNASGKGEVVSMESNPGNWLRMFPGTMYLSGNTKPFGENYTVEFDVIMTGTPPSGTRFLPDFGFGLLATGKASTTDNSFLDSHTTINNKVQVLIKPNVDHISTIKLESSSQASTSTFKSGVLDIADFSETLNRIAHYAIQVQKQRLRIWINEKKVFDVPRAINLVPALNQLYFKPAEYWPYNESNFGLYLSNFKIASGIADNRFKLISGGKLSTTGILFATGSSTIIPQSYGLLKEIGQALAENPAIKFRVTGYTDNEGDVKTNASLSLKRAEAICQYLRDNYKINTDNLKSDGKGSLNPVGDNKTKEGRAMNRRVDFDKI